MNKPGRSCKSGSQRLREVANITEWQLSCYKEVDQLKDDEAMDEEADHNG